MEEVKNILFDRARKFRESRVNCSAYIHGNKGEILRGRLLSKKLRLNLTETNTTLYNYLNETRNCSKFAANNGFLNHYITSEERNFPVAFSVLTYKDIEMLVRMLASFFRPQHYFCIHVDQKASKPFRKVVQAISNCFQNVILPSRQASVAWGNYSIVEAEILCLEALWKFKKWKYFINLTGQEMPLKTNFELVQILKAYKGGNDVDGTLAA